MKLFKSKNNTSLFIFDIYKNFINFWEIIPKDIDEAIPLNEYSVINIEDEIMKIVKLITLPVVCFRINSFKNK